MTALGLFSYFYLGHALASSRQGTMQRREARLLRFLSEGGDPDNVELQRMLRQYTLLSPDGDLLQVADVHGQLVFQSQPAAQRLRWPEERCSQPCFRLDEVNGHHMRVLQHEAAYRDHVLRITLAGQVDEHYATLRMVRNSYLIFLPLMLGAAIVGGVLLAHRALEPIGQMTRAAQTISIRDLKRRLAVPETGDEIQHFAQAWNDLLQRLDTAVDRLTQFTSDISHDLRTAVSVMMTTAEVSLRRERSGAEYQASLRTIALEGEATRRLLDDLLAASRADVGARKVEQLPVPLSEIAEEACSHITARASLKHQRLSTVLGGEAWVLGDLPLLRRLVMILLENAIKYTADGGLISLHVSLESDRAILRVSDTGAGIAPADLPRIFDRSFRADTVRNREEGGSGLGLSIAKQIVEAHYASLSVASQLNRGSCFTVSFPSFHFGLAEACGPAAEQR